MIAPTPPDRYAVLGHPVAHSQSPFIHALFAAQTRQHLIYERIDCGPDGFVRGVRDFAAGTGAPPGAGRARGCNVTMPFKFEVPSLARRLSERAALAQAANVLCLDEPGWFADNTDGEGLVRDLEGNAGVALGGHRLLLIGAGGAAAGVLGPLIERAPAEVIVVNRTPARAHALTQRHRALAAARGVRLDSGGLGDAGAAFDVVINASASSVQGLEAPVAPAVLRAGTLAVDLMYGAAAAPFVRWATEHGAAARDGLGMLVEQAALAFALWRGVTPRTAPVLAALRARLAAAA